MIKNDYLHYSVDAEGIATIDINQVKEPANLFSFDFVKIYLEVAQQAIQDEAVKGVIVTSSRSMFMAGGDLRMLGAPIEDAQVFFDGIMEMHQAFREVETAGKPFVAAINGTALGGGMELALTCHHRIAINSPRIKLGFPEAKVGLLPGGGGTAKAPYLMGIQNALMHLMQGKESRPEQALKINLIDAIVDTAEELLAASKAWILTNPNPVQPWDNKKHRIPGGGVMSPGGAQVIMGAIGNLRKMAHGNYPAQEYILKVTHDGLQLGIDRALEIEARYFTKVCMSKEAKNMIRTGFMGIQAARKGKARPKDEPKYEVKKLGMLGAGMMGAGIAYVSAKVGMEVILKDVSLEGAEKGKAYSKKLLDKAIAKKRSTQEKADAILARIHPTDNAQDFADCDLVIEAVFESPALKEKVSKETEAVLPADKVYGSNTSTIPITQLAEFSDRPENFIGIHFFSPVDRMPLVEIIVGKKTSPKAIAAAVDYTVAIKKVPIVVNDSRGFYTSRCFGTYVSEGMFLLEEGVPPAMIENIAKQKGMPVGPLAVHDEVTLTLSLHVHESDPNPNKPAHQLRAYNMIKDLVRTHQRTGKKDGAGFYDYPKGGKKKLWPKLKELYNSDVDTLDKETIAKRIMHRQALESYRCLDEGVLNSVTDGDVGSVLAWGFPIYTGGSLSYIDFVGMDKFIADCDDFAARFGDRFAVPDSLRALATADKSIHEYA
ncbi:MAG: 3-hydroxyacyl-CoA dehydrogenase NAD-binding domain-containing protein [Bacteroidia bacterium]